MMHSENPKLTTWYYRRIQQDHCAGSEAVPESVSCVCGLPQSPAVGPKAVVPYLEKCVKEMGFVGTC